MLLLNKSDFCHLNKTDLDFPHVAAAELEHEVRGYNADMIGYQTEKRCYHSTTTMGKKEMESMPALGGEFETILKRNRDFGMRKRRGPGGGGKWV